MKIKYYTCPKCGQTECVVVDSTPLEIVCTCCGIKADSEHLEECLEDLETF